MAFSHTLHKTPPEDPNAAPAPGRRRSPRCCHGSLPSWPFLSLPLFCLPFSTASVSAFGHESEDPTAQTCFSSHLAQRTSQAPRRGPVGPEQWASLPPSASSTLTRGPSHVARLHFPLPGMFSARYLPAHLSLCGPISAATSSGLCPTCSALLCFSPRHPCNRLHSYLTALGPLPS